MECTGFASWASSRGSRQRQTAGSFLLSCFARRLLAAMITLLRYTFLYNPLVYGPCGSFCWAKFFHSSNCCPGFRHSCLNASRATFHHQIEQLLGQAPQGHLTDANTISQQSPESFWPTVVQVASALRLWDRRGNFVFTSSIGVFATSDGCTVTENSPAHDLGESPRFDRCVTFQYVWSITSSLRLPCLRVYVSHGFDFAGTLEA